MIRQGLESVQFETPTGPFMLTFDGPRLIGTGWPALGARVEAPSSTHGRARRAVRRRFERYFEQGRSRWDFQAFETPIGTAFQNACWRHARLIEAGDSKSYGWLAGRIGRPGAARAVGQAMRANPLPIVVPCHRVVGVTPRSGGFSGTTGDSLGMSIKRKLLELEQPA